MQIMKSYVDERLRIDTSILNLLGNCHAVYSVQHSDFLW